MNCDRGVRDTSVTYTCRTSVSYKTCLDTKPVLYHRYRYICIYILNIYIEYINIYWICDQLNLPHQSRLWACAKPAAPKPALCRPQTCCDCQGWGLVARVQASILVFETMQVFYWPVLGQIQFCSFDRRCKTCLDTNRFCNLPRENRLCACSKTGFLPTLNQPLQNRLCACSKTGFLPTLNQPLLNRLCACSKTGFVPTINQPLQNRLCVGSKTSFVPSLNLLHQNRLCAHAQSAAPKPALYRH